MCISSYHFYQLGKNVKLKVFYIVCFSLLLENRSKYSATKTKLVSGEGVRGCCSASALCISPKGWEMLMASGPLEKEARKKITVGDAGHKGNRVGLAVEVQMVPWISALVHWRLHMLPGGYLCCPRCVLEPKSRLLMESRLWGALGRDGRQWEVSSLHIPPNCCPFLWLKLGLAEPPGSGAACALHWRTFSTALQAAVQGHPQELPSLLFSF